MKRFLQWMGEGKGKHIISRMRIRNRPICFGVLLKRYIYVLMFDLIWEMFERLPNFLGYWFGDCRLHWHWAEVNRIERYVKIRKEVKDQVPR